MTVGQYGQSQDPGLHRNAYATQNTPAPTESASTESTAPPEVEESSGQETSTEETGSSELTPEQTLSLSEIASSVVAGAAAGAALGNFDPSSVIFPMIDSQATLAEIQSFIHDTEMEMIDAMLDAIDRSLENAAEMREKMEAYIQEVVIPREEAQQQEDTIESVQQQAESNTAQQELNAALGQLQTRIQQAQVNPQMTGDSALANDIAQLQITLNNLLSRLPE